MPGTFSTPTEHRIVFSTPDRRSFPPDASATRCLSCNKRAACQFNFFAVAGTTEKPNSITVLVPPDTPKSSEAPLHHSRQIMNGSHRLFSEEPRGTTMLECLNEGGIRGIRVGVALLPSL